MNTASVRSAPPQESGEASYDLFVLRARHASERSVIGGVIFELHPHQHGELYPEFLAELSAVQLARRTLPTALDIA